MASTLIARAEDGSAPGAGRPLVIGLVNNMPDAALQNTERQFRDLLGAAAGERTVELRLMALAEVPRGPAARAEIEQRYQSPDILREGDIDGLIVTGTEPRSARLVDEPYWGAFETLIEWAQSHTRSTVWSCLAAHAAVLSMDGVERQRYPEKLFGVFECESSAPHELTDGLWAGRRVPHSRFNDVPEQALKDAGYRVLARSDAVGADLFVKQTQSLFVFLQGHPEYDSTALMREYRRDVGRYLNGERDTYPGMPQGYFSASETARYARFQAEVATLRDASAMDAFPAAAERQGTAAGWRDSAVKLYSNWLTLLARSAADGTRDAATRSPRSLPETRSPETLRDANHGSR